MKLGGNPSVKGGDWIRIGSPPKPCEADLLRKGNRQVVLDAISLKVSNLRVQSLQGAATTFLRRAYPDPEESP
jgi:hypothetical protein